MTEPSASGSDETAPPEDGPAAGDGPTPDDAATTAAATTAAEPTGDADAGVEGVSPGDAAPDATDAAAPDADGETDAGAETDGDDDDGDEDEDDVPPAPRRLRQVGAILAVISGFLLGAGLFLPYAASAGVDNPGMTIDFAQPSWVISMSNLGIPALVVLTGLAVLAEFMRPSVGSGVVLTASIGRLLTSAAGLAFLVMVGSASQISLSSGFYVLAIAGLLGLLSGAMLLAASRRPRG